MDRPGKDEPALMGIMAEILSEELAKDNIHVPFLEFPALSEPASEKRVRFWEDLETSLAMPSAKS